MMLNNDKMEVETEAAAAAMLLNKQGEQQQGAAVRLKTTASTSVLTTDNNNSNSGSIETTQSAQSVDVDVARELAKNSTTEGATTTTTTLIFNTNAACETTAAENNNNSNNFTSVIQQLNAKKNKSNLYLIKSYSFNEKTNHNYNSNTNTPQNPTTTTTCNDGGIQRFAKISTVSAPSPHCDWQICDVKNLHSNNGTSMLQSPDFAPFSDIETLILEQQIQDKQQNNDDDDLNMENSSKKKTKKQKQKKIKQKTKKDDTNIDTNSKKKKKHAIDTQLSDMDIMTEADYQKLLRKPTTIHEYEELCIKPNNTQMLQPRPQSMPTKMHLSLLVNANNDVQSINNANNNNNNNKQTANIKRESFIRQSLQSIRRSFGSSKKQNGANLQLSATVSASGSATASSSSSTTGSTGSASASAVGTPVLDTTKKNNNNNNNDNNKNAFVVIQDTEDTALRSLRHSSYTTNTLNPLVSVQSNSSLVVGAATTTTPTATATTTTSSTSAISAGGNNTAKQHDQQTAAVAAISTTSNAAAAVGTSGAGATALATATPAAGKEKKRKEVSSSRVKKFHRHFSQVSKDEKLINYFSCALVSDILLQGHLYITDQHFAFYSNVFGYITKVVIPTSSVTKISKEKTAKIIPNAVGVATADERHVFGSFISRESAFRLMCSVCPLPLAPIELLPNKTQTTAADIEISEEYSIEDDSSCSISGNESPPQPALDGAAAAVNDGSGSGNGNGVAVIAGEGQLLIRRTVATASSSSEKLLRHSGSTNSNNNSSNNNSLNVDAHANIAMRSSAPPGVNYVQLTNGITGNDDTFSTSKANNIGLIIAGSISSSTSNGSGSSAGPSTSSSPQTTVVGNATTIVTSMPTTTTTTTTSAATNTTTPKNYARILYGNLCKLLHNLTQRLQQRSELHMLYVGIMLAILLALFSVFLLYRILDIEAKTKLYNSPVDFNWRGGNDEDIFAEALRWQRELQAKTTEEAQTILTKNLEQISKVRRSLETLSMLIHDRSTAYANPTNRDDSD